MNAGTNNDVLRWMPPLVVSEAEIATALAAFAAALKSTRLTWRPTHGRRRAASRCGTRSSTPTRASSISSSVSSPQERSLSLTWYDVLFQLSQAGGRLRMQELAARLLIPRSSLTRQIDRMEAAGLVEREPTDEDGRGTLAVLTSEGRLTLAASGTRAPPRHR